MQLYPLSVLTLIFAAAGAWAQTESGSETSSGSAGGSGSATPTRSGSASRSSGASSTVSANPSSFPTLTPYSDCVNNCLLGAIDDAHCGSVVDVNCFCRSSSPFTGSYLDCLTANCDADELDDAEGLAEQFCALASPSTSLSFSSVTPSSSSSTSRSQSSGASSTSTSTSASGSSTESGDNNGAVALFGPSSVSALTFSGIGVLLGAAFVML
ncbi:hypothetical protein K525DRAFT_365073 [Schizophyllum commune Loenen D]|nr:hypothetical protein K525DRAFT_365073 [Schizophyllum commune Loenen D]